MNLLRPSPLLAAAVLLVVSVLPVPVFTDGDDDDGGGDDAPTFSLGRRSVLWNRENCDIDGANITDYICCHDSHCHDIDVGFGWSTQCFFFLTTLDTCRHDF